MLTGSQKHKCHFGGSRVESWSSSPETPNGSLKMGALRAAAAYRVRNAGPRLTRTAAGGVRKLGRLVVEGLVFVVDDGFARLLRVRVDEGVVGREGPPAREPGLVQ